MVGLGLGIGGTHWQRGSYLFGLGGGQTEKSVLIVSFGQSGLRGRRLFVLRPRLPAAGNGFNPAGITKHVALGFETHFHLKSRPEKARLARIARTLRLARSPSSGF